jgi:hypothetical protein
MPNILFNIKFPPYTPNLTFEQFRNECLKLQFKEKNRNTWIQKVHVKYLIPLLISTPRGMQEYFEDVQFSNGITYIKRDVLRILKKLNPEATGFKVFEMLNQAFPELSETYLRSKYDKVKKVHEDKETERKRLWSCTHNMEEYMKARNPLVIKKVTGKRKRLVSTTDYKFSHPRTGLVVTFEGRWAHDPSQEPRGVDHYTLRSHKETLQTNAFKRVKRRHHSADFPLVIKMKYLPPSTGDKGGTFEPGYAHEPKIFAVDNTGKMKGTTRTLSMKATQVKSTVQ